MTIIYLFNKDVFIFILIKIFSKNVMCFFNIVYLVSYYHFNINHITFNIQIIMATNTLTAKLCNISLDIQNIIKKISKLEKENKSLNETLNEEIEKRHELEKKVLNNQDMSSLQIQRISQTLNTMGEEVGNKMLQIKNDILQEVQEKNSKFMTSLQSHIGESNTVKNKTIADNTVVANNTLTSCQETIKQQPSIQYDDKYTKLENMMISEFDQTRKAINGSVLRIEFIEERLKQVSSNMKGDIISISNDIEMFKQSIEQMQNGRYSNKAYEEIKDNIEHNKKSLIESSNKVSSFMEEVDMKNKNYEDILQSHTNNFQIIKNDMMNQFKELNMKLTSKIKSINDTANENMQKQNNEFEHFEKHFIEEYKKFVNYIQSNLDKQNENIKQLIKYTNDDIDILKEKNVSLEHSMNVLRADLLKNVNEFEGFLSKKYDSLYRIVNHHTC